MGFWLAMRRNEIVSSGGKLIEQEIIGLDKINQTQKPRITNIA